MAGRPKKKPEYNPELQFNNFLQELRDAYEEAASLRSLADELNISLLKLRKLLITADVFTSDICTEINNLHQSGKKISEIMELTGLSRASVHSYLPYTKGLYNAAEISLNAERCRTYKIRQLLDSISTGDPFDPFALQKACLLACGIIPKEGNDLRTILERLGGGFVMHSEVTNVPKGSGLGTSSILSAACVKAVFEFMGIAFTEDDLYSHVLAMEQIMSTGGGWQDQVGGITPGLKYISSMAGIDQEIRVTHVEVPESARKELDERFVLIYTGQRRLARNLLRDVVGRYVGNEPDSLFALEEIQKTAVLMRFELERGNVDGFAKLLDYHWELSKKVDAGSSNTLIEQIFSSIEEMIDGRLVCGAGGGGFLQVILKKGVTRQDVENRLNEVFMDSLVGVADCKLVWE